MTCHNSTQNSTTFQAWKTKKQNSMTFQVFQDLYEPWLCNKQLTLMSFTMGYHTNTAHVTTTNNHCHITGVKLDEVNHLAILDVDNDGVIYLDERVWVPDGAGIVGNNVWYALGSNFNSLDTTKFVLE